MFVMQDSYVCGSRRIIKQTIDNSFDGFANAVFTETASKLANANKVVELEHMDFEHLLKKCIYQLAKRASAIIGCTCALITCTRNLFFRAVYA